MSVMENAGLQKFMTSAQRQQAVVLIRLVLKDGQVMDLKRPAKQKSGTHAGWKMVRRAIERNVPERIELLDEGGAIVDFHVLEKEEEETAIATGLEELAPRNDVESMVQIQNRAIDAALARHNASVKIQMSGYEKMFSSAMEALKDAIALNMEHMRAREEDLALRRQEVEETKEEDNVTDVMIKSLAPMVPDIVRRLTAGSPSPRKKGAVRAGKK